MLKKIAEGAAAFMRCNIRVSAAFLLQLLSHHHQGHAARRDRLSMSTAPVATSGSAHIDIHDRAARSALASRLGVDEERLRKAARMVGSRITSITAYLSK